MRAFDHVNPEMLQPGEDWRGPPMAKLGDELATFVASSADSAELHKLQVDMVWDDGIYGTFNVKTTEKREPIGPFDSKDAKFKSTSGGLDLLALGRRRRKVDGMVAEAMADSNIDGGECYVGSREEDVNDQPYWDIEFDRLLGAMMEDHGQRDDEWLRDLNVERTIVF